ncbi:MAG: hypothetical protein JST52_08190 [Bacteroidetes bacterium]|nr:hypothetical protein [Bacteroidota bacterium]MBS1739877.1 hypothetical protein [Bacteroidota bacterium]
MIAILLFIFIGATLLAFAAAALYRAFGTFGSWWLYRKVCIPVSAFLLILFGWVVFIDTPTGITLIILSQVLVALVAEIVYKIKIKH